MQKYKSHAILQLHCTCTYSSLLPPVALAPDEVRMVQHSLDQRLFQLTAFLDGRVVECLVQDLQPLEVDETPKAYFDGDEVGFGFGGALG
jgi:uncharacterized heparinase superfamily protein